jgi:hypothetical protein
MQFALHSALGAPMKPGQVFLGASAAMLLMARVASAQLGPALPDTSTLFGGTGSASLFTGAASGAGNATGLTGLSPAPTSVLPRLGTAGLSPTAPSAMSTLGSGGLSPAPGPIAPLTVSVPTLGGLGLDASTMGTMAPITLSPAPGAIGGGPHFTNYGLGGIQPLPGSPAGTFNGLP